MSRTTLSTTVAPGAATAVVGARAAALVDVGADDPRADPLLEAIEAGGGPDEVLAALTDMGLVDLPAFALVLDDERGLRALIRGPVEVEIAADDPIEPDALSGDGLRTWLEVVVPDAHRWELRLGGRPAEALVPIDRGIVDASAVAGEVFDAPAWEPGGADDEGRRPVEADDAGGGGVVGALAAPPTAGPAPFPEAADLPAHPDLPDPPVESDPSVEAAPSVPEPFEEFGDLEEPADPEEAITIEDPFGPDDQIDPDEPDPEAVTEMLDEGPPEDVDAPGGRPVLDAVLCPQGHPSRPDEPVCVRCERPIEDRTVHRIERPVVATLLWDSGRAVDVDRPLVIGRNPSADTIVDGEPAVPLRVPDPEAVLSRQHLEVRLSGWDLLVVDRGSRNHTVIIRPGEEPERLLPDVPTPAPMGTEVVLAEATVFRVDPPG